MNFSSELIERAVEAFAGLPGIGKKTALRLVLHMISRDETEVSDFAEAITAMKKHLKSCSVCHNLSDNDLCRICEDPSRDPKVICVVEDVRDVMAIENTGYFKGRYHILGGIIKPIDGIGPEQLNIDSLVNRIKEGKAKEIIMAISPTIEGETTIFYLSKQMEGFDVSISNIARGISFGGELQYADETTLGRSIMARTPYTLKK